MKTINDTVSWGIIGAGDVCEVKSAPAFNKVQNSRLMSVMRRDFEKVKDYAQRHGVPNYTNSAEELIYNPDVNAIYIATPPAYHVEYAIMSMEAGKPVYIEKPVSINSKGCERLINVSKKYDIPVSCAYYRRRLPLYQKVMSLLAENKIGQVTLVGIKLLQTPANVLIADSEEYWRVIPDLSGGGLFHDLAPHQLDIMYCLFGEPEKIYGLSMNQSNLYNAPDVVNLEMVFKGNIMFNGLWAFNVHDSAKEDKCEICGEKGKMSFPFFHDPILEIETDAGTKTFSFTNPEHIQQLLIEDVVKFFKGDAPNPCPLEEVLHSMKMLDATL